MPNESKINRSIALTGLTVLSAALCSVILLSVFGLSHSIENVGAVFSGPFVFLLLVGKSTDLIYAIALLLCAVIVPMLHSRFGHIILLLFVLWVGMGCIFFFLVIAELSR